VRLRKPPLFLILLAPAALLLPTVVVADEVYLKGAGSISGRIVEQNDKQVMIDIGGGVMGVPMANVERIVKARSPLDDYDERAARLAPGDVNGWRELARWAGTQGLTKQANQAWEKVLAVSANDPEAKQAMGFVLHDGRWVTEEESYRARGYVLYDNEWMTPGEAQMLQANATAEQARQDAEAREREAATEKMLAESRAAKAAERAADERRRQQEEASWSQPVYWGGWGYGVTTWPANPAAGTRPLYTP
jgi:hypothetical protein